jgi:hypothetical protein
MRKPGADAAQITPTPDGWRLHLGGAPAQTAPTLPELIPAMPEGSHVDLALPCHAALLERMTLPATDREELAGMIQLHLEKTLPYPVEEVTSGFEIIEQTESETTLLSIAVHGPVLAQLCDPLRHAGRVPAHLSLFALDLVPHLPTGKRIAAIWGEPEHLAIGIYQSGKLSWAYSLLGTDAETLRSDLLSLLLTAEVEGVPTSVESVVLASDCEILREPLQEIFDVPIGNFAVAEVRPRHELNLLPPDWASAANVLQRQERLQQRLLYAAAGYLLVIAIAFVYLAWTKRRVQVLDAEIARIQPAIASTQQQQARLLAMAPALDRSYYAVEQMYLVDRNRPPDVNITQFDASPLQFVVKGEAPNAGLAIDFAEKLRAEKELSIYQIESGPPKILQNNHAQFSISGKR